MAPLDKSIYGVYLPVVYSVCIHRIRALTERGFA